jgi:hypothetical protein
MPGTNFLDSREINAMLGLAETKSENLYRKIRGIIERMDEILVLKERLLMKTSNAVVREIKINQPIELHDVLRQLAQHTDMLSRIAYQVTSDLPKSQIAKIERADIGYKERAMELDIAIIEYNRNERLRRWLIMARKEPEHYKVQNPVFGVPEPKKRGGYVETWTVVDMIAGKWMLIMNDVYPVGKKLTEEEKKVLEDEAEKKKRSARLSRVRAKALPIWEQFVKEQLVEERKVKTEMENGVIPYRENIREIAEETVARRWGYKYPPPLPFLWEDNKKTGKYEETKKPNPWFAEFYEEIFNKQKLEKQARKTKTVKTK